MLAESIVDEHQEFQEAGHSLFDQVAWSTLPALEVGDNCSQVTRRPSLGQGAVEVMNSTFKSSRYSIHDEFSTVNLQCSRQGASLGQRNDLNGQLHEIRSNRFHIRNSVPVSALVRLQVAFSMRCLDPAPFFAHNSGGFVVAVREVYAP